MTLGVLFSTLLAVVAISRLPFCRMSDKIVRRKTVLVGWLGEISVAYILFFTPKSMPDVVNIGIAFWMLLGVMDRPAVNA